MLTLLFVPAGAHADSWLDQSLGNGFDVVTVRVPGGAVPPGPAVAEIEGVVGPTAVRVRFRMPGRGDAHVRVPFQWSPVSVQREGVVARVTGARGVVFRRRIRLHLDREQDQSPRTALFLGRAGALGDFLESVRTRAPAPTPEDTQLGEVRLGEVGAANDEPLTECRSLARASVVVADRPGARAAVLARCAARGARVVILDPSLPAQFAAASPGPVAWGAGTLAWTTTQDDAAAAAIASVSTLPESLRSLGTRVASQLVYAQQWTRDDEPRGVSEGVVLACLLAYVLVLGPLGWLVLRRRNTVLSWVYFPAVALVATAALGAATIATDGMPDRLEFHRRVIAAPDGTGLAVVSARVLGTHTRSFTVVAPSRDADFVHVARPFRFGSPFTTPAGAVELVQDVPSGTLRASGIAVSRWSEAGVTWVEPVTVAVPRLERAATSGEDRRRLVLVAASDAPTRVAAVVTRHGWALAEDLSPGERRTVTLSEPGRVRKRLERDGRGLRWMIDLIGYGDLPSRTAVVVSDVRPPRERSVRVSPRVPVEERTVRVLVGVLP